MSIINEELIEIDANLNNKEEVITHFAEILDDQKRLSNKDLLFMMYMNEKKKCPLQWD